MEAQLEGWKRRTKEGLDSVTGEVEQLRGQVGQGQQALQEALEGTRSHWEQMLGEAMERNQQESRAGEERSREREETMRRRQEESEVRWEDKVDSGQV